MPRQARCVPSGQTNRTLSLTPQVLSGCDVQKGPGGRLCGGAAEGPGTAEHQPKAEAAGR